MTEALRPSHLSIGNKLVRGLWQATWLLLYRPSPRPMHAWRSLLLRLFGAKLGKAVYPYPSARIWAPWNLEMRDHSCLGEKVNCYCVDKVVLCAGATVSQYSFLCTASHDYRLPNKPMTTAPIIIGQRAWVAADAFIGPGVSIGEGAIVGARACVFRDVDPWTVVGGNPAKVIRKYQLEPGE
jgi:putative colanic acid biosynthesis acetyltransferase WcaF